MKNKLCGESFPSNNPQSVAGRENYMLVKSEQTT